MAGFRSGPPPGTLGLKPEPIAAGNGSGMWLTGMAGAITSASSALQDSLHPAGDVPAHPRRAQITPASHAGRPAEVFHTQTGTAAVLGYPRI